MTKLQTKIEIDLDTTQLDTTLDAVEAKLDRILRKLDQVKSGCVTKPPKTPPPTLEQEIERFKEAIENLKMKADEIQAHVLSDECNSCLGDIHVIKDAKELLDEIFTNGGV